MDGTLADFTSAHRTVEPELFDDSDPTGGPPDGRQSDVAAWQGPERYGTNGEVGCR